MCKVDVRFESDEALIAHIERVHHTFLKLEIPALHALLERVAEAHARYDLDQARRLFEEVADALLEHACKEQNVLFPMVQSLCPGIPHPVWRRREVGNVTRVMQADRARIRAGLIRLRAITEDFAPADFCPHHVALMSRLAYFERVVLEQLGEEERLNHVVEAAR